MVKTNKKVDINTFMAAGNFINNVMLKHCFTLNTMLASKFIYHKIYCNNNSVYKEACPSNNILDGYIKSRHTEMFVTEYCSIVSANANQEDRDEYNNFVEKISNIIDYYNNNVALGYDPMHINKCLGVEPNLENLLDIMVDGI